MIRFSRAGSLCCAFAAAVGVARDGRGTARPLHRRLLLISRYLGRHPPVALEMLVARLRRTAAIREQLCPPGREDLGDRGFQNVSDSFLRPLGRLRPARRRQLQPTHCKAGGAAQGRHRRHQAVHPARLPSSLSGIASVAPRDWLYMQSTGQPSHPHSDLLRP